MHEHPDPLSDIERIMDDPGKLVRKGVTVKPLRELDHMGRPTNVPPKAVTFAPGDRVGIIGEEHGGILACKNPRHPEEEAPVKLFSRRDIERLLSGCAMDQPE